MNTVIESTYGNRLRVRVCGLLEENNGLLMVSHRSLATGDLWIPPGGGVNFGEPATAALEREVAEETGLSVKVVEFQFACEFIKPPLHAVELFFRVKAIGGRLKTGSDPETHPDAQIIREVRFVSWTDLETMKPEALHGIFRFVQSPRQIMHLTGYFAV